MNLEWKPIETAPKHRKVLAAYRNRLGKPRVVIACYHTKLPWSDDQYGEQEGEFAPEGWYEESDSAETIYPTSEPPVLWMEIPDPSTSLRSLAEGGGQQ